MSASTAPDAPALPAGAPFSRRIPLIVAAAFFMETLDGTIVTTALPAIAQSFHAPVLRLTPSVSAYLLAVSVFVATAGWLSERIGARRLFASAVAVFTLASVACALSPTPAILIGARAVQGASAAFMSPVGRIVVLREIDKRYLIEAIAIITWPALIGPVVGPPLAGFLTTYASWRWIFLINVPIGLAGVWLVLRHVPTDPGRPGNPFDLVGFLFTGVALAALVEGMNRVSEVGPGNAEIGVTLLILGSVTGVLAVRHSLRTRFPMLELRILRAMTFAFSTVTAGMIARIAIGATPFLLPLMFEIGFGMQPFEAGAMLLIYMVGNLGMKTVTTPLLRWLGFRRILTLNGALCVAAIAACGLLSPGLSRVLIYATLLFAGMTRSMHLTALSTLTFADIAPNERAGASAIAAMSQQLSFTLGVAFAALVLALAQHGHATPVLRDFREALWAAAALMGAATLWALRLPSNTGAEVAGKA